MRLAEMIYTEEEMQELREENKRLKEVYEVCNLDSINKTFKVSNLEMENKKLKEENEKLKEERDFFKEQATLWRNDYKNEYEENRKLKLHIEAKDKSYLSLSKAYEGLQKDRDEIKVKIAELEYIINAWKKWKDEHFNS